MIPKLAPMYEIATRAFEKLMQLKKDALRTKPPPQPIEIVGNPEALINLQDAKPCLAIRDAITERIWTASSGIHLQLIIKAEAELGLPREQGNSRFVAGYLQDGKFVTGLHLKNPAR